MEELIVLIANGIAWLFRDRARDGARPAGMGQSRPPPLVRPGKPGVPGVPGRVVQQFRRPPPRRRGGPPMTAAVAAPILTRSAREPAAAPPMVARQGASLVQGKGIAPKQPTVGRSTLSLAALKAELTPTALRQQIIVSELLRPPLALRDTVE